MTDPVKGDAGLAVDGALRADAARIGTELLRMDGGTDPFAAAVYANQMPMVVTDPRRPDNPIVFANDSFCRLTGYARSEVVGLNCRFLQGPETDPAAVARLRAAVQAAEPVQLDICNHRKDGTPFWNRLLLAPVRDGAGELAYFFASQVDVTLERERLTGLELRNAALLAEVTDRLRAQEASEARLARILATTPAGIVEVDGDGCLTYANPAAERILGAPPGTLAGRRHDDLLWQASTGETIPAGRLPTDWALKGVPVADYEAAVATVDGRRAVLLVDAVPVQVPAGSGASAGPVQGALAAFQDVTARQDAVQALRLSEERYRTLFDALDAGFCIVELQLDDAGRAVDYRFLEVNPAFETQTGLHDVEGRWVRDVLPELEQHWFDAYGSVATSGEPVRLENAVAALGRWYEVHAFRVGEAAAQQVAILFNDISGRRRAETELRASEARLRRLTETLEHQVAERTADRNRLWQLSTDIMLVARHDGTITAVNPAWTAVLGWPEAELIGQRLFDFIHPEDVVRTDEGARLLAEGATPQRFENRYRHKDGGYRWITWAAVPGDGLINGVGRDTTAEKEREAALEQAQEALRQSQKMEAVGQLTGGIAHDFNNMLQAMGGALEMLQRRVDQGRANEATRFLGAARETLGRAAALTNRLLAFARRQTLLPVAVEPDDLIGSLAELLQRTVGPAVHVELRLGDGVWSVLCDQNQLENVLLNFAINARDAMPEGGRLTFSTRDLMLTPDDVLGQDGAAPGAYVEIAVADTGIGMDEATRARAFEPFFTTKPIGQGTGLGLSQAYGFVRQSGGVLRLESAPGQGTTLRVFLPRHEAVGLVGAVPERPAQPGRGEGETILLVEDEGTVRSVASERLRELGYYVLEAANGGAALQVLHSGLRIDLLLTAVGLAGGMNGRQVAEAARGREPGLPVLFITGYAGSALEAQLAPGMEMIGKPFALDALTARVRAMLDRAAAG